MARRKQKEAAFLDLFELIPGFTVEVEDGEYIVTTGIYADRYDGCRSEDQEKIDILTRHFEVAWNDHNEAVVLTGIKED